jgi:hypothetical protein
VVDALKGRGSHFLGGDMQSVLAVPLTHVFLASMMAYSLPEKLPDCVMEWDGYETVVSKEQKGDAIVVEFRVKDKITKYEFKNTELRVSSQLKLPNGKTIEGVGKYDLKARFGIEDPKKLAKANTIELKTSNGKKVTMKLTRENRTVRIEEAEGDSKGVFGYGDEKFPTAKVRWKE